MRPSSFDAQTLRQLFHHQPMATLPEMMQVLGTHVAVTVFRKLKLLDYVSSYSHRGRFYTLREVARFDDRGLWSCQSVWFSRYGTLLTTAETFVNGSPQGYWAEELADALHVEVHDALRHLVEQGHLSRQQLAGRYLYTCADAAVRRLQVLERRAAQTLPLRVDARVLEISADELRAGIILFYSLLDEQQRRLYAGLESLKLGHGGDHQLAEFLGLEVHTVARGRQQLLDQDVQFDGVRRAGAGRKPVEKKRRK
jgi:hypothetical protein